MEEKTEVFKRVASEAKDRQWKSFCETLNRDTILTHFWQFYRQMEGCAANTNTPDLIDLPADQYWRQARKRGQHYSNASPSRAIRTIWMKGKQSGKGWTEPWQRPARMTTWSQSWNSPKHFPDWARIQLLVLTGSNTQTLRTCQYITKASSSDCTKKASQQDRFPRIGFIVTSSQSQNQEKTIASWTDTVSSQCRTQRESWWNGLWPGSLLRT